MSYPAWAEGLVNMDTWSAFFSFLFQCSKLQITCFFLSFFFFLALIFFFFKDYNEKRQRSHLPLFLSFFSFFLFLILCVQTLRCIHRTLHLFVFVCFYIIKRLEGEGQSYREVLPVSYLFLQSFKQIFAEKILWLEDISFESKVCLSFQSAVFQFFLNKSTSVLELFG